MAVKVREKVKGSGEWWVFINHRGRRRSKKVGSRKAASEVAREVEARLAAGDMSLIRDACPTVAVYGKKCLHSSLQPWKDSTRENYTGAFKHHIKPRLGNKRLDEIKRADVKYLIEALKAGDMSSARVQTVKNVLSGIFTSAIEDEIISVNPCAKTGKYAGNGNEGEITPLTLDEVSTLLENAAQRLSLTFYTLFLLLVRTGLRIGEALALEWSDIDFENRKAEVSKNYDYTRGSIVPPKNDKPRKVDLSHNTVEALKRLRASMKVIELNGAIFTDDRGQRLGYKPIYEAMRKLASRSMRIHDLRHTYCTFRLSKGDKVLDVSQQLGHHSVAFTIDKYGHWIPGEHQAQVGELDDIAPVSTPTAP